MPPPRLPRHLVILVTSLFITTTLIAPIAWWMMPHARRWHRVSQLDAQDPRLRSAALNYVIRFAGEDERVLRGAIEKLDVQKQRNFVQIVNALDRAGRWEHPPIPAGPWLRWLKILAEDMEHPTARISATQKLGALGHLAGDPRLMALLQPLLEDPDPDVRYNALTAAARLTAAAAERRPAALLERVAERRSDPDANVARHAWIFSALLGEGPLPDTELTRAWRDRDRRVAEAALWAAAAAAPDRPGPVLAALESERVEVVAAATYALSQSAAPEADRALRRLAEERLASATGPGIRVPWRAMLGLAARAHPAHPDRPDQPAPGGPLPVPEAGDDPERRALRLAAIHYNTARLPPGEALEAQLRKSLSGVKEAPLDALAALEALPPRSLGVPIDEAMPEMVRLAALRASDTAPIQHVRELLLHESAPIRDLACLLISRRFDRATHTALVDELLRDLFATSRMAGALLAGLTGVRPTAVVQGREVDILAYQAKWERQWHTQTILRLGLWMQERLDDPPEASASGPGERVDRAGGGAGGGEKDSEKLFTQTLLFREDLPRTSVLLAMLHRGQLAEVMQFLLNPLGEPQYDLVELLDRWRWWYVLEPHLPAGAPPFWVWADPELETFQIDLLRDWWLLHHAGD